MNERIKELLNQAGIYQPDRFDAIDGSNQMEKFAELIVQECVGVVENRFMGDLNREDMEVRRCAEDLKKHFGVKE
jgi:hypothetical protein